jgi:hypothetical protein
MVAEAAVVGFPHEIKGEGIYAFVTLKEHVTEPLDQVLSELKHLVKTKIASYAVPEMMQVSTKHRQIPSCNKFTHIRFISHLGRGRMWSGAEPLILLIIETYIHRGGWTHFNTTINSMSFCSLEVHQVFLLM